MEDLIAAYPDDFFPRHLLTLRGRQETFRGIGRFDLHFCDQFDSNILMELKAVPARYEDATQLAKYRDAMKARGDERIIMWLVAPLIPSSVREFLTHIGIEFTEIHASEFQRIADLRGVVITQSPGRSLSDTPAIITKIISPAGSGVGRHYTNTAQSGWHFNTDESEVNGATSRMFEKSCFALWGYPDAERRLNKPERDEAILFYRSKVGVIGAAFVAADPCISSNDIFGKQAENEFRRGVRELLTVSNEKAVTAAELRSLGVMGPLLGSLCRRYSSSITGVIRERLESRSNVRT